MDFFQKKVSFVNELLLLDSSDSSRFKKKYVKFVNTTCGKLNKKELIEDYWLNNYDKFNEYINKYNNYLTQIKISSNAIQQKEDIEKKFLLNLDKQQEIEFLKEFMYAEKGWIDENSLMSRYGLLVIYCHISTLDCSIDWKYENWLCNSVLTEFDKLNTGNVKERAVFYCFFKAYFKDIYNYYNNLLDSYCVFNNILTRNKKALNDFIKYVSISDCLKNTIV